MSRTASRKASRVRLPAAAPVLTVVDADGDDFVLDFGHPVATARTAAESAEHRAHLARQNEAAEIAYNGALSLGFDTAAADRAAAKARRETT